MWLEGNNLGVLTQHRVGMQFLSSLTTRNADVDTVPQADEGILVGRFVVFFMEAKADLQMSGGITAIGVKMNGVRNDRCAGFQQAASTLIENVCVAANFMDRPW